MTKRIAFAALLLPVLTLLAMRARSEQTAQPVGPGPVQVFRRQVRQERLLKSSR